MCGLIRNFACLETKVYPDGPHDLAGCEKFYGIQIKNKNLMNQTGGSVKYFRHCGNEPFSSTMKEVGQLGYCHKLQESC
jgi:hypothetical protein